MLLSKITKYINCKKIYNLNKDISFNDAYAPGNQTKDSPFITINSKDQIILNYTFDKPEGDSVESKDSVAILTSTQTRYQEIDTLSALPLGPTIYSDSSTPNTASTATPAPFNITLESSNSPSTSRLRAGTKYKVISRLKSN